MKHIVSAATLKVSTDPVDELRAYGVGAGLGLVLHDAEAGVGGMLHALLPEPPPGADPAGINPALFVATGLPLLLSGCERAGARSVRARVWVCGAARTPGLLPHSGDIAARNLKALGQVLHRLGLTAAGQDVGGAGPRTMTLRVGSGQVAVTGPRTLPSAEAS